MVESMQETLEVQNCIRKYPWLIHMVKSKQFHESCDQDNHTSKKRCYFCCDCKVPPLCDLCYKFRNYLGSELDELMENSEISEEIIEPVKKKQHRRKGCPQRSPFY